jgi:hypothetical protein
LSRFAAGGFVPSCDCVTSPKKAVPQPAARKASTIPKRVLIVTMRLAAL